MIVLEITLPIVGIVFVFLLVSRVNRTNINTALGLHGQHIALRDHNGHEATVPIRQVIYNRATIATPDMADFLGQPQMAIYDREVLKAQVFPRLIDAKSVSNWEMQTALIRMWHPQGVFILLMFAAILVAGIWILLKEVA